MARRKASKKDRWFIPVRGSYLPRSWQAWGLYVIACCYLIAPLAVSIRENEALALQLVYFVAGLVIVGMALTWIAEKKS